MDSEILKSFMEERQRLVDYHLQDMQVLLQEIERLNNIINGLEKYLAKQLINCQRQGLKQHYYRKVLMKLHDLRGIEEEGEENVE